MAYSRLLLLLIGVISSHLPGVQARHIDFWCNRDARKNMGKTVEGLKRDMLQQKRAEVLGALRVLEDGVHGELNQTTSHCQTSLLERLGHHITNYVGLVNSLQLQNDTGTSPHPVVQIRSSEISLRKVLEHYDTLLRKTLERFAIDLRDHLCKEYRRAVQKQTERPLEEEEP